MELISTITAGAGAPATLQFASIPQTYTDLMLVFSLRRAAGSTDAEMVIRFNDSTSGYQDHSWYGYGNGAAGAFYNVYSGIIGGFPEPVNGTSSDANTFSNGKCYIPNYTSGTSKQMLTETAVEKNVSSQAFVSMYGSRWNNGSAINNIKLVILSSPATFDQFSTVSLYGITKGSGGANVA